jgi:amino acid transporter
MLLFHVLLFPVGLVATGLLVRARRRHGNIGQLNWVAYLVAYLLISAGTSYFHYAPIFFGANNDCGHASSAVALRVPHDDPSAEARQFVDTCHTLGERHLVYGWLSLGFGVALLLTQVARARVARPAVAQGGIAAQ